MVAVLMRSKEPNVAPKGSKGVKRAQEGLEASLISE
jgi:hypothetical protein